jgi:hypothetical protein
MALPAQKPKILARSPIKFGLSSSVILVFDICYPLRVGELATKSRCHFVAVTLQPQPVLDGTLWNGAGLPR